MVTIQDKTLYCSLVYAGLIDFPERSSLSLYSLATSPAYLSLWVELEVYLTEVWL